MSATATLCTASIAIATVSGGLFVSAAPALHAGVKQVELIDDYIVVHSDTTPATSSDANPDRSYIVAPAPESTVATTAAPAPAAATPAPAPAVLSTPSEMSESEPMEPDESESTEPMQTTDERSDDHSGDRHHSDDNHEHESDDGEHEGGGD